MAESPVTASRLRLLVTVDVEIAHDRGLAEQDVALWRLHEDMQDYPATWFCTAAAAEQFSQPLRALAASGHSIGCHGLDHGTWEDYRRMSQPDAARALAEATRRIETALGVSPRVFRGPRMTTSAAAHQALRQLGYRADFSVCSRRMDFMSASRFDWRWATAAPAPYRPARGDPFRREGQPSSDDLVVVPLSGFALPLCSGTVYLAGEWAVLKVASALRDSLASNGWPLVYLFHSYEFTPVGRLQDQRPMHQRLYPSAPDRRYEINRRFLSSLRSTLNAEAMTADQFLQEIVHV